MGESWVASLREVDGPEGVLVEVMAVEQRHRGQGGFVAREMVEAVLSAIEARALEVGAPTVDVACKVWHENGPSMRLCEESGLERTFQAGGLVTFSTEMLLGVRPSIS